MKEDYHHTRKQSLKLCLPLEVEDYVPQPSVFVSPPKWHLAHTTWFFEEFILQPHLNAYKPFDPKFGFMFNSYYNTVGARVDRADRGYMTRPTVDDVLSYRTYVDEHMDRLLTGDLNLELQRLLDIGLNHEQQHQELLLTDIKYILGRNPMFPEYDVNNRFEETTNDQAGSLKMNSGLYQIGASSEGFTFDNEHNRHTVYLDDYSISKALVSNGEYLDFILDQGYERHELWLDEGWAWINDQNISAPLYWHKIDDAWMNFTLGGLKPLNLNAMLSHVSHFEAAAFAEWSGKRLPTEFEWEAASDALTWGARWEHTSSAYLPYPGFSKPKGAVGEYNGKFMMNQMVLRGGSVATPEGHSRKTYRNFFHPNMQWQFSGIRLVDNE